MKKWLITLGLVAALLFTAACGRGDDDDDIGGGSLGNWDNLITVSASVLDASASFAGEPCEIYQFIQTQFGITFEPMDLGWDNMDTLPLLWASANTLPDIIGGVAFVPGSPTWIEWAEVGLIRPVPSDLSRWPNVAFWLNQPYVQELAIDGNIYFIPRGTIPEAEITALARGIINRRDWREQLGIPVPRTEQDFLDMWQAFVDNAAVLPGAAPDLVFGVLPGAPLFLNEHTFTGHGNTGGSWSRDAQGNMTIPAFEYSSLPLLSFWRRAFNQGLVDPDFITNPVWQGNQNFAMGRAGTLLRQVVPIHMNNVYLEWVALNPDINFVDAIEILQSPDVPGITPVYLIGGGFWSESLFSSNVSDAKMERIMYFYDWMLSEDGINTMMFGFEGRDWEWRDGEIHMLTPINPATGMHMASFDLYQFAAGGMRDLAIWAGDAVEWFDPNIPQGIRDMATANRNRVIVPGREYMWRDGRVAAMVIHEIVEMGLPSGTNEFVAFITDTSDISDRDLWQQFRDRWESMGLLRAYEVKTAAVRDLIG